ncbi:MAG: cytochrome b [Pseudomonadota bacterium]
MRGIGRPERHIWHGSAADHYGLGLIALHWLTLALIATAFALGLWLADMPLSPLKLKLYAWHKWIGLLVLALLPLRLWLRVRDRLDRLQELEPWEARLSALVHGLIYLLMVLVPLLGWLHSSAAGFSVVWFGVLPLPDLVDKQPELAKVLKAMHESAVYFLAGIVVIHALAALYHHHIQRDQVLRRMIPWLRAP